MGLEDFFRRRTPEKKPESNDSQDKKSDGSQEKQDKTGPLRERVEEIRGLYRGLDARLVGSRSFAPVLYELANIERDIEEIEAVPLDVLGLRSRKIFQALNVVEQELQKILERENNFQEAMKRKEAAGEKMKGTQ